MFREHCIETRFALGCFVPSVKSSWRSGTRSEFAVNRCAACNAMQRNATRCFQAQRYYGDPAVEFTVIVKIPNRLPEYPRSSVSQTRRNATRCDAMRIEFRKFLSTLGKIEKSSISLISNLARVDKASGINRSDRIEQPRRNPVKIRYTDR